MTADLSQFRDGGEYLCASLGHAAGVENLFDIVAAAQQPGLINLTLLGGHFGHQCQLELIGQLGQHILFETAHQERTDALHKLLAVFALAIAAHKRAGAGQVAGQDKIKYAPQLSGVVFHGRTGEGNACFCRKELDGVRADAGGVFDLLRLVQHGKPEGNVLQKRRVAADQRVAGHQNIGGFAGGKELNLRSSGALRAGQQHDLKLGRKPLELAEPVIGQRRGGDDDRGLALFFRAGKI